MFQLIYGNTNICGKNYLFCYKEETEEITLYLGMNYIKLPYCVNEIVGQSLEINGKYTLYKLNTPLLNHLKLTDKEKTKYVAFGNQTYSVDFIISNYYTNSKYIEMKLQFPELDYLMPSSSNMRFSDKEFIFSNNSDSVYSFDIQYRDSIVSIVFNKKTEVHCKVKSIAETTSEITLKFPETDDMECIIDLYYSIRDFFSFICNRQNIGLRSAILVGKHPKKAIENNEINEEFTNTNQKLVPSHKYLEPLEDKEKITKVPRINLFKENLNKLLQLFFEEKVGDLPIVNGSSIHPSFKYRNLIDLKQSLHITATFEYYMRTMLPEISSQETIDFFNDIEDFINEYIETSKGKKKKKAKSFKKSLRPQVSLAEKISKAYDGYSNWQSLKPILSEWFGDDISILTSVTNKWRNELAHEKREYEPDKNVIKGVRLVEHINYCIVLRHVGYVDEQIKLIVSDILAR